MPSLIDVDAVLTHAQLDDYLGGKLTGHEHLAPLNDTDTAKARTFAVDEVLAALASRTPPVYEAFITIPAELRRSARHAAAARLYDLAATSGSDAELNWAKMRLEEARRDAALAQLKPTVADGVQAPALSSGIVRR